MGNESLPRAAWKDPRHKTRLHELWHAGKSSTEIALLLSREFDLKLTRNAVIGKASREGLAYRGPAVADNNHRRAQVKLNNDPTANRGLRRPKPAPRAKAETVERPNVRPPTYVCEPVEHEKAGGNSRGYTLMERPTGGCSFVLNVKRDGQWLYCGAPAESRGGAPGHFTVCDLHQYTDATGPGLFKPGNGASLAKLVKSASRLA